jgi:hypothetical protein
MFFSSDDKRKEYFGSKWILHPYGVILQNHIRFRSNDERSSSVNRRSRFSGQILAEKSNQEILTWNFAHKKVSQSVKRPGSFNQNGWSYLEILNAENELDFLAFLWKIIFFSHSISRDELDRWFTFRDLPSSEKFVTN